MPLDPLHLQSSGHAQTMNFPSPQELRFAYSKDLPPLQRLHEIPEELRGLSTLWNQQELRSNDPRIVNARIRLPQGDELQAPIFALGQGQGQAAIMLRDGLWELQPARRHGDAPVYEFSELAKQDEVLQLLQRDAKRARLDKEGHAPHELTMTSRRQVQRPPTIHGELLERLVVSAEFPLRLENQHESTRVAGVGTGGAHALNQAFQAAVATAASLHGGGLQRLKTEMRDLTNVAVQHHELYEGMGTLEDYEARRKELCREFDHSGVAIAEIGKLHEEDKDVENHMVTLVRVAAQPEMDAGVWLLDSVMKAPIWFADIDKALDAIEQVNQHDRNEGRRFLSVLVPEEPLPPVVGAQSVLLPDYGLLLSHRLHSLDMMGVAAAAWNLDIEDLPSTAGHSPGSGKLDHGDAEVWIAQSTERLPESSTSIDHGGPNAVALSSEPSRPGAQTPEARWLGAFLDAPLQPTPAAIQALLHPPPHGPLVDHYAHVLREHYGPIATTQHLQTEDEVDRFAARFQTREHRLLVTLQLGDDGEGASRTFVLRRGDDDLWSAHSDNGLPSDQPPAELAKLLNDALLSADAGGLRVLRMAPGDEETLLWLFDKTEPKGISSRQDQTAIRRLVDHLAKNRVPVSALALHERWPLGPADRDVERALLSLVARGAVSDPEHVDAIVNHLRDADARRATQMVQYADEIAQWRDAWKAFDMAKPENTDRSDEWHTAWEPSGTADDAEEKLHDIEARALATREKIDYGGRDALTNLVQRVAQDGGLPFNVHELTLLLPEPIRALQDATKAAPRETTQPRGSRGGSVTKHRNPPDPMKLNAQRTRPLFTTVLQHCPPPPDSMWDTAKFTLGSGRQDHYEPRYRLNRQLCRRYEQFLQDLRNDKKITSDAHSLLRSSMLRLLRRIEEGTAPVASNPLDSDDGQPRARALAKLLPEDGGLNKRDRESLTSGEGFVTWLDSHLDDERRVPMHEQGLAPRPARPVGRGYNAAELKKLNGEYRAAALHAQEALLEGDRVESTVSRERQDYKLFLELLQAGEVQLTTDLVSLVPVGELAQALRAFGQTPTFDAEDDRAALLRIVASTSDPAAPALIGLGRFLQLPDSLANAIVLQVSHKYPALRAAINRVHRLHLMGDTLNINHPPRLAVHAELMRRMHAANDAEGRRLLLNWIVRLEERWTQADPKSLGSGAERTGDDDRQARRSYESLLPDDIRKLLGVDDRSNAKTAMQKLQRWLDEQVLPETPLLECNVERLDRYLATLAEGADRDNARQLIMPWIHAEEAALTDLYVDPVREAMANNDVAGFQARVASKLGQTQLSQEQQRAFAGLHASGGN